MNWLDSVSMNLVNKDLDGLWTRLQTIQDNIANIETPGYKSKSVSFEDQLKAQLSQNSVTKKQLASNIKSVSPVTSVSDNKTLRADGNNVDAEKENIELTRAQLNYTASLQAMTDQFSRLRIAITGSN